MEISNGSQAREMIEEWRSLPVLAQERQLRYAVETLELNLMYHEQKGRPEAARRNEQCLTLLRARLTELQG